MSSSVTGGIWHGPVTLLTRTARRPWVTAVAALIVYLTLAAGLFSAAWRAPATMAVGSGTDPIFSIWFLQWVPFAIGHGLNPLLTTYLDYPSGANLTWSGLFPLPALLLSPVTVWLGPVVAYNLLATLGLALSAWAAFLAIRRYVNSAVAAAVGGLLYGFSPALVAQSLGHPQIAVAIIPPLMLLALDDMLVRQRHSYWRSGAILGLLAAAQLLIGEEFLAAEALVAAAGTVLLIAANRSALASHASYVLKSAVAAVVVFLLLTGAPLAIQFLGPQRVIGGSLQPANVYVSDLFNFIVPTSLQQFAPRAAVLISDQFSGSLTEWNAYVGIPLLAVLVLATIKCREQLVMRLSGLLALLFSILSLGVTLHLVGLVTPIPVGILGLTFGGLRRWLPLRPVLYTFLALWIGLAIVPVVNNVLPGRLMVFVFLFAAILVAGLIDRLPTTVTKPRARVLLAGIVGLSLLALFPRLPYPAARLTIPAFFTAGVGSVVPGGSVVLIAPYARGGTTEPMLWQAESTMAFRMPEGYALIPGPRANPPASGLGSQMAAIEHGESPDLSPDSIDRMRGDLAAWSVGTVVVGPMPHRATMVAFLTTLLGRTPSTNGGVEFWQGLDLGPSHPAVSQQ